MGRTIAITDQLIVCVLDYTPLDMPIPTKIGSQLQKGFISKFEVGLANRIRLHHPRQSDHTGLTMSRWNREVKNTNKIKWLILATRWSNVLDSLHPDEGIESMLALYESDSHEDKLSLEGSLKALSKRLREDAVKTSQLVPAAAGGGQGDKANAVESKSESESDECLFGHGDEQEDTVEMEGSTLRPPKRGREDDENGELGDGAGRVAKIARWCWSWWPWWPWQGGCHAGWTQGRRAKQLR